MKRPLFRLESTNDTKHYDVVNEKGERLCKIIYAASKGYWFVGKWGVSRKFETKEQALEAVWEDYCSRFEKTVTGFVGQRARQFGYNIGEVTEAIIHGYFEGFKTQEQQ